MSAISHITETIPQGFNDPKFLIVAGAVAITGVLADIIAERRQADLSRAIPLADPELLDANTKDMTRTGRWDRVATYGAVGAAVFGLSQLAQPYGEAPRKPTNAIIILDAGYRADVKDMAQGQTRLQASIDGSLAAANAEPVPFSFVLEGAGVQSVDSLPATNKNTNLTASKINAVVVKQPTFRLSESLASSVQSAVGEAGSTPTKIIIITANPGTADEAKAMQAVLPTKESASSVHAVVTGQGTGQVNVGGIEISSTTDSQDFKTILGDSAVKTATSADQVKSAVESIVNSTDIKAAQLPNQLPGDIAGGLAGGVMLLALRRRFSGLRLSRKGQ